MNNFEANANFSPLQKNMENGTKYLHESESGSRRNGKTVSLGSKRVIPIFVVYSFGFV